MSVLKTPLFDGSGMFNASGKRRMMKLVKNVGEYSLFVCVSGEPDRPWSSDESNRRVLWVEVGEYVVSIGLTEHDLCNDCGAVIAAEKMFGSFEQRNEDLEKLRAAEMYDDINAVLDNERALRQQIGSDVELQANFIHGWLDSHAADWKRAKNGETEFPDCIGAALFGELELWKRLRDEYKAKRDAKIAEAEKARMEWEAEFVREQNEVAEQKVEAAIEAIRNGGTIQNETVVAYENASTSHEAMMVNLLAKRFGVNIPLRTQGWINQRLNYFVVKDGALDHLNFMRKKNNTVPVNAFRALEGLIQAVNAA